MNTNESINTQTTIRADTSHTGMTRQLWRTAVVIRNPQFLEKRGEGSRAWSWTDGEYATPVNSESWNTDEQTKHVTQRLRRKYWHNFCVNTEKKDE